jgi:hypothetical protein
MVEFVGDTSFDVGKVYYHTITIQLFGFTIDGNDPVMSMQISAFAFIGQPQTVGCRYFQLFFYVIHILVF